jgi:hypothetical protein
VEDGRQGAAERRRDRQRGLFDQLRAADNNDEEDERRQRGEEKQPGEPDDPDDTTNENDDAEDPDGAEDEDEKEKKRKKKRDDEQDEADTPPDENTTGKASRAAKAIVAAAAKARGESPRRLSPRPQVSDARDFIRAFNAAPRDLKALAIVNCARRARGEKLLRELPWQTSTQQRRS